MKFSPENLLDLYRQGVFPMAESHEDTRLMIIDPHWRGIIPLDNFHIPSRLKRTIRKMPYRITSNQAFSQVIESCAEITNDRQETWINNDILELYNALHQLGHAHSIEAWDNDILVGGLYGVSLGGIFFGESMFSRKDNASKIALVHLVAALNFAGYSMLDAQFHNNHLEQFGIIEIPRKDFQKKLKSALKIECAFPHRYFGANVSPSYSQHASSEAQPYYSAPLQVDLSCPLQALDYSQL